VRDLKFRRLALKIGLDFLSSVTVHDAVSNSEQITLSFGRNVETLPRNQET
jgi:hypothetical protein